MNSVLASALLIACVLTLTDPLVACSPAATTPSIDDVRQVLETYDPPELLPLDQPWLARSLKAGEAKIVALRKTNGQAQETSGTKKYKIFYDVEVEVLKEVARRVTIQAQRFGMETSGCSAEAQGSEGGALKAGSIVAASCEMVFENSESGWIGPDGKVY